MIKIKAIILCAGYATRLYPLTEDNPKPLIEVAGRPILEHILFNVGQIDPVDEIFIVTNDKFYGNFLEWSKNFRTNKKIKIVNDNTKTNEDRLGAIGDINFVIKKEAISDDLMVVAGDNLFEFSLSRLYEFFNLKKSTVIALYDVINKEIAAKRLGVVSLDKGGKIVEFAEKPEFPKTSIISTACYIIPRKSIGLLAKCMEEKNKPDNLGEFMKWLSIKNEVYGQIFTEKWFDIGSFEQLEKARREFNT